MVSLIASTGIMVMAVYYYFRTRSQIKNPSDMRPTELLNHIFFEVILGMMLMSFSIVISDIRFDFRFLLFIFSAKYMGPKVTIPTILILGVLRFVWGFDSIAQVNMGISFVLAIVLPLIVTYTTNKLSDLFQLFLMGTINMTFTAVVMIFFVYDKSLLLMIEPLFFCSGYLMIYILHWVIKDLQKLTDSVNIDHLTSLQNVRAFNDRLASLEQQNKSVTIGIIDIDHFKNYNDSYGHDSGDEILKQLAQIFEQNQSTDAIFYRIGGEEFAVLIETKNTDEAASFLQHLLENIASQTFLSRENDPLHMTVSIGAANREKREPLKKTLKRADIALYTAKANGRKQVVIAKSLKKNSNMLFS